MEDHKGNSDSERPDSKSFGSLKRYWENLSNQRMEADYSVPTRPHPIKTKSKKVRILNNLHPYKYVLTKNDRILG